MQFAVNTDAVEARLADLVIDDGYSRRDVDVGPGVRNFSVRPSIRIEPGSATHGHGNAGIARLWHQVDELVMFRLLRGVIQMHHRLIVRVLHFLLHDRGGEGDRPSAVQILDA